MKRAVDLLQEATTKFPDHLDIWCGLAYVYQESRDFDNELSTLKKMVAYAREHPSQLKWLKDEPMKEPADNSFRRSCTATVCIMRRRRTRRMISAGSRF